MRPSQQDNPWRTTLNIVGARDSLPSFILNILWCQRLSYRNRLKLVTFFIINHLPLQNIHELLLFVYKNEYTSLKIRKVHDLYNYIIEDSDLGYNRREKYCAYSVIQGRVLNLNGHHNSVNK